MAAKKSAAKATGAIAAARDNPYIQRIVEDPDLRDTLLSAYGSAREAFERLSDNKAPATALLEDRKLHKDLSDAAVGLREAALALRAAPKKKAKRSKGVGRLLALAVVGGIVALVVSEGLRQKLLDALFGKEEEFDYAATTAPAPAPAG